MTRIIGLLFGLKLAKVVGSEINKIDGIIITMEMVAFNAISDGLFNKAICVNNGAQRTQSAIRLAAVSHFLSEWGQSNAPECHFKLHFIPFFNHRHFSLQLYMV